MKPESKSQYRRLQAQANYPAWICSDCGHKHGKPRPYVSTYHMGDTCGWCGEEKATTEPRDFSYPEWRPNVKHA